jgi:hypothetical protein
MVEGAITIDDRQKFEVAAREFRFLAHEDKKGYVSWRSPSGRSFRVLRPPLVRAVEEDWASRGGIVGRWSITVRGDGSWSAPFKFHPFEGGNCSADAWQKVERASRRLCEEAAKGPGLVALVYGAATPWAEEYLRSWTTVFDQADPQVALVNTVEIVTTSGHRLGLLLLPAHPIRLAWHIAYDQLASYARYEEGVSATSVVKDLSYLDSAQFPSVLPGIEVGQAFIFGDTLGFHTVAMVSDRDSEPKAAISLMAAALAGGARERGPEIERNNVEILAHELGHYLECHSRSDPDGRQIGPDLLNVHAIKPGDGMTVARALGRVLKLRQPPLVDEDDDEEPSDLCFTLDLFPSKGQEAYAGRFLLDVARRRRAAAGIIGQEDRWMVETVQRPGDIPLPRLRWARRDDPEPCGPAHVTFAFDIFDSNVESLPLNLLPQTPRPLHSYGLVVATERQVSFENCPTWRTFVPRNTDGEKHPVHRKYTDWLVRFHEALLRAAARNGDGQPCWPVLFTRLSPESEDGIRRLHATSDWVVTADRNACIEYFDSPHEARAIYDAYVIDCVPERTDLGCLQLVTSTCNLDEVRDLFDEMLGEMGLTSSARNCEFLLWHLKGLSGRLAIRLSSQGAQPGELVALALIHAACASADSGSPDWLPLAEGFFISLDEIGDVVPRSEGGSREPERADLVYVTAGARRPLEFRFVEVKFRRHLRTARGAELVEKIVEQTAAIRKRWLQHFFEPKAAVTRSIRRSSLARLLFFYADKARRHYLAAEAHERIRREVDKLLLQGDAYEITMPERPDYGYIFCPELRTVELERLYISGQQEANLFLVGTSYLPDNGALGPPKSIVSEALNAAGTSGHGTSGPEARRESLDPDVNTVATLGVTEVILGVAPTTGDRISWRLSINSNPHLMIVGLPGMGKTTCLANVCRQLHTAGIKPVVFSFHEDIDAKIETACGGFEAIDYDGLGFNPLQVASGSALAHIDVASELRDIFSAIFPDLGEIQTEEIRQAIKQSYVDLGWGTDRADLTGLSIPSFQTFFDLLQAKPKPNQGVVARLTELSDYGFFKSTGLKRSLLDFTGPTVVRIHRTSNELLQRAFAAFVLYSIYKDMFKRGPQSKLTHAVVFDEAHRASRLKLLPTMAKECRKFGVALVVASQEARDFDLSLFSAIANYLALRINEHDAKAVARTAASSDIEKRIIDRLKQLKKYNALFFTEGSTRPTTVELSQ